MPEVEIILRLIPSDLNFLKVLDYPLGFFEKFAQIQKIQLQFELISGGIITFFKTKSDLEKLLQLIGEYPLQNNPNFIPSNKVIKWECECLKPTNENRDQVLKILAEKIDKFLGQIGQVELKGNCVSLSLPDNFFLDKYFSSPDVAQNIVKILSGSRNT